ncbi:unnamed protein product [Brachionus calyciflorus]|uniref:Tubulin epsilon and delta complex protein 1 domain-containing protein n=1 Tax=Brachionus calyciflorus TaxID=104777 RepID=A0A813QJZ1_9BILA|nr:unnamed protein product [Brachionus calyciflorus]
MSQIQVKQIISSFCKILEYFNFSKITPEDLRLAKFNKPNAAPKMWKLLFELVNYLKTRNKLDNQLISNEFDSLGPEKVVKFLKEELLKLGYSCDDFFKLKSSFDENDTSSREILISIGWLISSYEIIKLFIANSNSLLDEEYFKENALMAMNLSEVKKEVDISKSHIMSSSSKDLYIYLNNLKLFDGTFKNNLNSLHSCLSEKVSLTHKVHSETSGSFSCLELHLLKNPDQIEKYEKILEKKIEVQNNFLLWIKNEEPFWTWMESVLDEKISENELNLINSDEVNTESFDYLFAQVLNENVNKAKKVECEFDKNVKKLEDLQHDIKSKIYSDKQQELDRQQLTSLKHFEKEIIQKFQNILLDDNLGYSKCNNRSISDTFEPRLNYIQNKSTNDSQKIKNMTNITEINRKLDEKVKCLENIFDKLKQTATTKCEQISSELEDCYVVYNE